MDFLHASTSLQRTWMKTKTRDDLVKARMEELENLDAEIVLERVLQAWLSGTEVTEALLDDLDCNAADLRRQLVVEHSAQFHGEGHMQFRYSTNFLERDKLRTMWTMAGHADNFIISPKAEGTANRMTSKLTEKGFDVAKNDTRGHVFFELQVVNRSPVPEHLVAEARSTAQQLLGDSKGAL